MSGRGFLVVKLESKTTRIIIVIWYIHRHNSPLYTLFSAILGLDLNESDRASEGFQIESLECHGGR